MVEFIGRFILINENQTTKKLDLNYFLFGGIRLTPLDPNYLLKFNYFQSIMGTLDSCSKDMIIFYAGYLVYNTLNADAAMFFYNYYYSLGEPFKFDETKIRKKFTILDNHKQLAKLRYGYFINSINYAGIETKKDQVTKKDSRSSNIMESRESLNVSKQVDLLGLDDNTEANLI